MPRNQLAFYSTSVGSRRAVLSLFTTCLLSSATSSSIDEVEVTDVAYPWRNHVRKGNQNLHLSSYNASVPAFKCPPGPYLSSHQRTSREAWLSDWAARRLRERFGRAVSSHQTRQGASGSSGVDAESAARDVDGGHGVPSRSIEDHANSLMPPTCPPRGSLTTVREACGAWHENNAKNKNKRWAEFKCTLYRPDAARSEYFLLGADQKDRDRDSNGNSNNGNHRPLLLPLPPPKLVVSRVWKTGSTALAQVFRCLYSPPPPSSSSSSSSSYPGTSAAAGRTFLHYASLEKHRGPFVEKTASSNNNQRRGKRLVKGQQAPPQPPLSSSTKDRKEGKSTTPAQEKAFHRRRRRQLLFMGLNKHHDHHHRRGDEEGAQKNSTAMTLGFRSSPPPPPPPTSSSPPPPPLFVHAALVRDPLERLVSGYREILARLTFGDGGTATATTATTNSSGSSGSRSSGSGQALEATYSMINFKGGSGGAGGAGGRRSKGRRGNSPGVASGGRGGNSLGDTNDSSVDDVDGGATMIDLASAVATLRVLPGWPRIPLMTALGQHRQQGQEQTATTSTTTTMTAARTRTAPSGSVTENVSGTHQEDRSNVDVALRDMNAMHAWLWVGKPTTATATTTRSSRSSSSGGEASSGSSSVWDEEARFRAFVGAVECAQPFLWWAHVASASWFLNGPRHVLTSAEARAAFKAGASSPADAAHRSESLDLDVVMKHESFNKDLEALLFPQSPNIKGEFTPSSSTPLPPPPPTATTPLSPGGACRSVASQRYNSGDEASRAHLPRAQFYRDLLLRESQGESDVGEDRHRTDSSSETGDRGGVAGAGGKGGKRGGVPHQGRGRPGAKEVGLMCRLVDIYAQDYACFDYALPLLCRRRYLT